jgi:hypothetical protein
MPRQIALFRKSSVSTIAAAAMFVALGATSVVKADSFMLSPENAADVAAARAPALSAAEQADFLRRFHARREAMAATAVAAAGEADAEAEAGVRNIAPTDPGVGGLSEVPDTLTIGRNAKNLNAEAAANSTLAEPAAINNRNQVLYAGNFSHLERSTNHGVSYTALAIPAGPADAPISCCDNDMAIDETTRTGFHSYLYINAAQTNGAVRIFVKSPANLGTTLCSYLIDPAGAANNILPDYPHIAVSNLNVYLTINAIGTGGNFARIYRFNKNSMRNCLTTSTQTFTQNTGAIGQRVWVPAGGGYPQSRMMWVQNESSTSMRVFNWNQVDAAPTSVVRAVSSSVFANPDCRGGIGNFDFIERSTATSIAGFRTRCTMASGVDQATPVLTCYNHSAPKAGRPHAFLRGTTFRISDRVLISQPDIFSNTACWGYPSMASNTRGNLGMALAYGGRTGGAGAAVRGVVLLRTLSGTSSVFASAGVANRSDGRYGDYVTTERYQTCAAWFGSTAYSWDSSPVDAANDVNARWVEFGREGDLACYNAAQ